MPTSPDHRQDTAPIHPKIQVVLFDYGQVLSMPPEPIAWKHMQQVIGLTEEQLHAGYWALRHQYDEGAFNGREYWQDVAQRFGINLDSAKIAQLIELDIDLWTSPNLPMIAWAERLQCAGVRTAILSNIGDAMAIGVTSRLPWLQQFERCVWSYALRLAKPAPEIFLKTVAMLTISPQAVLFVDDKEENIAAAAGVGMQAIRYTTQAEFEQAMRERGFTSLLEVSE